MESIKYFFYTIFVLEALLVVAVLMFYSLQYATGRMKTEREFEAYNTFRFVVLMVVVSQLAAYGLLQLIIEAIQYGTW